MTEFSIEEKAKAYDEAIKRARYWEKNPTVWSSDDICQKLFPELKESEDERIRKEILEYFNQFENGELRGVDITPWIAWLEKQEEKSVNKLQVSGELYEHIRNTCACIDDALSSETLADINDYLSMAERSVKSAFDMIEKQGEQILANSAKTYKDEQKPADKVKPKFHEGDWVVQGCNILKIRCVGDEYYCFETVGGYVADMLVSEIDSQFHLWTIQDAKDGDVLVYGDNPNDHHVEITMIFKSLRNEKSAFTHFHIFNDYFKINDWCDCGKNVHPATKEQREQLEKAMADAGYEWDAEKKELKKIENEIEIPFGAKDSELQEVTYYIPKGFHAEIDDDKVVIKKGEKSADKVEPFDEDEGLTDFEDEYEGLTDFERTLTDICMGWINKELGWKQYIKDNADVLLKIAIKKFNSVQDTSFKQNNTWSELVHIH